MPTLIASDGVKLNYEIVGDGPPIILHLGAGCDSGLWDAAGYLGPLAKSFRCILFDHRGHGSSDHPSGTAAYELDRFCDDVEVLIDQLDLGQPSFWAYSNAILVGLRLADRSRPSIRCLIGNGRISKVVPREQLAEAVTAQNETYRKTGWDTLIAGFESQEGPAPDWMKQRIRATDSEPVIAWNEAALDRDWKAWDALGRVGAPTLFFVGELEDPDDVMAEAVAAMPDGTRVRIPGKGHINGYLDSEFVLPLALSFLRDHA
jgi:pimeloyl-ACP methyl ester carboxylesterase